MSTTTEQDKRPYAAALAEAEAFRDLFPPAYYERWEIAGSIRRRRPLVGDVEHLVIPREGELQGLGLFPEIVNLLWHHLDAMERAGTIAKHYYGANVGTRWGKKTRGVDWRGFRHEIYTCDSNTWGAQLAIRTGPQELSTRLVNQLKEFGYDHAGGFAVVHVGSGGSVPTPDEQTYFRLCGEPWAEPEART